MTQQSGSESIEIERKYEVVPESALPGEDEFRAVGFSADPAVVYELDARYFDTAGGDLAALRIAVRRRSGGKDAGWHLKERFAEGVREVSWSLSDEMPTGLREELRGRIGAGVDALELLTTVRSTRTVVVLRDLEGREAIELADDAVRACDAARVRRAWREWEAELLGSDAALLARLEPVLIAAGASPSPSPAKVVRASGLLPALAQHADPGLRERLRRLDEADRAAGAELPDAEFAS